MPEFVPKRMTPTPTTAVSPAANAAENSAVDLPASVGYEALQPLLTFRLGGQQYALLIDDVVEVAAMVEMIRLAGSPAALPGVVNRHGQPLPLLDLRRIFDEAATTAPIPDSSTLFIVTRQGEMLAGLIVDEVLQVEYLPAGAWSASPSPLIAGIISHGQRLIQVIALAAIYAKYLPAEYRLPTGHRAGRA